MAYYGNMSSSSSSNKSALSLWLIQLVIIQLVQITISQHQDQLSEFSIKSIHTYIANGHNCSQVIDYFLQRAYVYNPKLHALISFNSLAKSEALELDEYYWGSDRRMKGRLHCVPVLVKDNVDVKGLPTTGGIKALRYSIPNRDSLVIERLRREGALIVAKANLAELASSDRQYHLKL